MSALYLVMNNDLGMTKGKAVSQGGHAVEMIVEAVMTQEGYQKAYTTWKTNGRRKICLKGNPILLESLKAKYCTEPYPQAVAVYDMGLTQVPANSLTCIGFFPTNTKPEELDTLKLY